MHYKKGRSRTSRAESVLLAAPLFDPNAPSSPRGVRRALREMSPEQRTSLSPVEYLIFSGKGPYFFVEPKSGNSDEKLLPPADRPETRT